MGFFDSRPSEALPGTLSPLTVERVTAALDSIGARYGIDDDGDPGGVWDDHIFYFLRFGDDQQILQVRGRWMRDIAVADGEKVRRVSSIINDFSAQMIWPKAYLRVEGDVVGLYSEVSVNWTPGVSDEQIEDQIRCGIGTSLELFAQLDAAFPDEVERAKQEIAARSSEA